MSTQTSHCFTRRQFPGKNALPNPIFWTTSRHSNKFVRSSAFWTREVVSVTSKKTSQNNFKCSFIRNQKNFKCEVPPKPSKSSPHCKYQSSSMRDEQRSFQTPQRFYCGSFQSQFCWTTGFVLDSICWQHQHLEDVKFQILRNNSVTVLSGQDNFDLTTLEQVLKGNNKHRAIQTKLGWTLGVPNQTFSWHFTLNATIIKTPATPDNQL